MQKIIRSLHHSEYELLFGDESGEAQEEAFDIARQKVRIGIKTRVVLIVADKSNPIIWKNNDFSVSQIPLSDFLSRWKWKNPIQTKFDTNHGGGFGNCVATCFANYLGKNISEIPPVETLMSPSMPYGLWGIVSQIYFSLLWMELLRKDGHEFIESEMKDDYYFVSGTSPRFPEYGHMVMYKKGKMVFDPHPDWIGITEEKTMFYIKK